MAPPSVFIATEYQGHLHVTGDISYVDDLVSTTATLPGLQRKADILYAFTVLFDVELYPAMLQMARGKRRTACLGHASTAPAVFSSGSC